MVVINSNVVVIGVNSKYSHSNLALRYFRENSGCDIFECSINDNIFDVYLRLLELNYDIFCFSTYIWNIEYISKLIPILKNAKPEIKIILGGPEAGYNYKEIFEKFPFIYGIIFGEGEQAIAEIVKGTSVRDIPNYIYNDGEKIVCNEIKKVDLRKINFPYKKTDIQELKNKIIYFETSRGCCFNCSYCLSSSEGKTRYFDMEYVKKGIKFFIDNNVSLVKFVDRTFNENNERACEILEYIVENNKNTKFHFEVSPMLLTKEFCDILAKAKNNVQLEIGIQTTNTETMKCIRRSYCIEDIQNKLSLIPKGIHVHMDIIAGLPKEDLNSFINGFDFVFSLRPDMLQLGFLKLLHNTKLKDEADFYGVKATSFPPYEVICTNTMSVDDLVLLKKVEKAVERIYNSGAFCHTIKKITGNLVNSPFDMFKEIGTRIYEYEKNGPLSRTTLYEMLYDLFGDNIKGKIVRDFVFNNPNIKVPEKFLSEDDKNIDLKYYRKIVTERQEYKDKKVKLVAAGGEIYIISDVNKVATFNELTNSL